MSLCLVAKLIYTCLCLSMLIYFGMIDFMSNRVCRNRNAFTMLMLEIKLEDNVS